MNTLNTPDPALDDAARPPPSKATTQYLNSEKGQQDTGFDGKSTKDSSLIDTENEKGDLDNPRADGESPPETTDEYPSGPRLVFLVVGLVLSVFLACLDQTIVGTAIPKITDEFHGLDKVSWYGSVYFMTFGGFQSPWGKVYKYFPLKISFLISIFIFELGSLICGVAPSSTAFIVGRAIAGCGSAGLSVGSFTLIALATEPRKRPQFTGIVGATYGIAAVCGPLIGGALTENVSWRWCFYINLPIGGLAAFLILFFFSTPSAVKPAEAPLKEKMLHMDPIGIILTMGAIISFILALQYGGQTKAWNSSVVIGLLVGFVCLIISFVFWEIYQGERAMVVPRLIKQRSLWASCIYQPLFGGSYFALLFYLPIYFQSVQNVSPIESGVRNLPAVIAVILATILSGGLVTKTGHATPLMLIGSVLATIASGLCYSLEIDSSSGKWIGYQILGGLGWGLGFQITVMMTQARAKPEDIPSATAILLSSQIIGGAFCISAAQSAFVNKLISVAASTVPEVDPVTLILTGATQIRHVFSPEQVPGVVIAYMEAIKVTFAIVLGTVGFTVFMPFFVGWEKLHGDSLHGGGAVV